jgi:hypothetical protein
MVSRTVKRTKPSLKPNSGSNPRSTPKSNPGSNPGSRPRSGKLPPGSTKGPKAAQKPKTQLWARAVAAGAVGLLAAHLGVAEPSVCLGIALFALVV